MSSYQLYSPTYAAPAEAPSTGGGDSGGGFGSAVRDLLIKSSHKFANPTDAANLYSFFATWMMMLTMSGMMGKRRRRSSENPIDIAGDEDKEAVFKFMTKLDEDDCIGLLICNIASQPPSNRTKEEAVIVSTMNLTPEVPVAWNSVCDNPIGKYRLAAEIGYLSQTIDANSSFCEAKFKNCRYKQKELMATIQAAAEKNFKLQHQST